MKKAAIHWGSFLILCLFAVYMPDSWHACIMRSLNGLGGAGKAILFTALVGAGGMLVNRIMGALISPYDRDGKSNCECGRLPAGPTGRVDYFGYIRRDFPIFWIEPWKWLFGGWPIIRGVLNVETGNITITPKMILWVRKNTDPVGEWIGFSEVVTGKAALVVINERDRIKGLYCPTQEELDRLSFIEALQRDGVVFDTQGGVNFDKEYFFKNALVDLKEVASAFKETVASKEVVVAMQEAQVDIAEELEKLKEDFNKRKSAVTRAAVKAARDEVLRNAGCKCDTSKPKKAGGK